MSRINSFHMTARGQLHILKNLPCEDASVSFSEENEQYHIAAAADGHGAKACFRSGYGAKAAVKAAADCLKQFAASILLSDETESRFYKDILSERYRQMTIRHLTDTILKEWYDTISEHYVKNPPTPEEINEFIPGTKLSEDTVDPHIYGTTLMAALQLPGSLILLQQGDGRCVVFFEDGHPEQPVPWDERCQDNTTTSLCDPDAKERFRSCIICWGDQEESTENTEPVSASWNSEIRHTPKPVSACYLGTDGIEDAYRDTYDDLGDSHVLMGGVHTFYKDLTCQLAGRELSAFEGYLETWLPDFSANGKFSGSGSGDDVSVAGIADLEAIESCIGQFQRDVELYSLEEQLFWKEDQLRSKQRKHSILRKRMEEAAASLTDAEQHWENLLNDIEQRKKDRDTCSEQITDKEKELENFNDDFQTANQIEWKSQLFNDDIMGLMGNLSSLISRREVEYHQLKKDLSGYEDMIQQEETLSSEMIDKIQELEDKTAETRSAFDEYDSVYRQIEEERDRILAQIQALKNPAPDSSSE